MPKQGSGATMGGLWKRAVETASLGFAFFWIAGCTVPWKKQEEPTLEDRGASVRALLSSENRPSLVHEIAVPIGLDQRVYESYGLVTGLYGTGGDIAPSAQREFILNEMRANDVHKPQELLASGRVALVKVSTISAPGAMKDDRVDVTVEISKQCDATSLYNGTLLEARLQELRSIDDDKLRKTLEKAKAKGPIFLLPRDFTLESELQVQKGRILGGARLQETRILGLRIRKDFEHVMTTNMLGKAINDRFSHHDGVRKRGAAVPKDDGFIQIDLPTRYRQDPRHFIYVVLHLGFLENGDRRNARMELCRQMLAEAKTARQAAMQLEALGEAGVPLLREGMAHPNPEIQFYSAYSLAYLNDPGAIPVLEQLAQQQPAFRGLALIGLSVLDHFQAGEALERLLQSPEPEVRFGALHALRKRDDGKRSIHAQWIGETLEVVMVPSAIPLVTVALENAPEVTFFGDSPQLQLAQHHEINPRLLVRPDGKGQIRIVRFQPGDEDRVRLVQADLRSVLTGLQEVGASYNDMIQFLDQTKASSWVSTPIAFNPRPTLGRTYQRDGESSELLVDGEMSEGDFGGENSDTAKANDDSSDSWNWWPWSRKAESDAASETRAKAGTSSELIETPNKEETAPLLLDAGNSP
jgi:hypothetical protein